MAKLTNKIKRGISNIKFNLTASKEEKHPGDEIDVDSVIDLSSTNEMFDRLAVKRDKDIENLLERYDSFIDSWMKESSSK